MPEPSPSDDDANYDDKGGLVAKQGPGDNAAPLTISEISALLKRAVEDRFGYVRVRGELSGVKRAASGHLYLALKDESARLDGVMWRGQTQRLAFQPEDGLEVIATGKLTTYPGRSNYQIDGSDDGVTFTTLTSGVTSGTSIEKERINFSPWQTRFLKITVFGNSVSLWASITDIDVCTVKP